MEVEEGERLSFLDVEVIRYNGTLKKKLSHHNYRLKIGIMRSIIIRSLRLTDVEFWDEELDKLREDIPRQWLLNRSDKKKHTGREKPMAERGL
ncbi:unnamed protein product [Protopolystoma xenopodis]|uniref:Helix-turn-helix domain-containing protein n=1 Tax=Protopolystoma xenopodis TaxID=117903 RepID=A0A448XBX9_9PLAT|nr:unnamed protein product [Protopolystoma xenopodis]